MSFINLASVGFSIAGLYEIDVEIARLNVLKMSYGKRGMRIGSLSMTALNRGDERGFKAVEFLREMFAQKEKEIDQKLEELKARRAALDAQKQEFQKYVAEGIKNTFKNNYA